MKQSVGLWIALLMTLGMLCFAVLSIVVNLDTARTRQGPLNIHDLQSVRDQAVGAATVLKPFAFGLAATAACLIWSLIAARGPTKESQA